MTFLKAAFVAFFLIFPSTPAFSESLPVQDPKSKADEVLSMVELQIPDLSDESEEVRQAIIQETANLEVTLGHLDAAMKADIKDPDYKEMILGLVAVQECQEGKVEDAEARVFKMSNTLYKVDAHTGIGKALTETDKFKTQEHFQQASDLLPFIENETDEFDRQKNLALAQLESRYLAKALAIVTDISGDFKKAQVLAQMIMHAKDENQLKQIQLAIGLTQDKFIRNKLDEILTLFEAKSGWMKEALDHAGELPEPEKVMAFCKIALMQWELKKTESAADLLKRAEEAITPISDNYEKSKAFGALASTQLKMNLNQSARENFQKMKLFAMRLSKNNLARARLCVEIAEGQRSNGQTKEAHINFYEARNSLVEAEGSTDSKARLFSQIAKGQCLLGYVPDSTEFFSKAKKMAGEGKDIEKKIELLINIASDQNEAKLTEEAEETLEQATKEAKVLEDEEDRANHLKKIALAYIQFKDLDKAQKLSEFISSPLRKGDMCWAIGFELAKNGNEEEAISMAKNQPSRPLTLRGLLGAASGILLKASQASKESLLDTSLLKGDADQGLQK